MISPPQNPKPPNFLSDYAPATEAVNRGIAFTLTTVIVYTNVYL